MDIRASINNTRDAHQAVVSTDGKQTSLEIKAKSSGRGSGINGGELLFLSLATCYCNDIFREAESLNIIVHELDVHVGSEFSGRGDPAKNIYFDVTISADGSTEAINQLLRLTDSVAEIQNTLRIGVPVVLRNIDIR